MGPQWRNAKARHAGKYRKLRGCEKSLQIATIGRLLSSHDSEEDSTGSALNAMEFGNGRNGAPATLSLSP
jgi:hypothetical protein